MIKTIFVISALGVGTADACETTTSVALTPQDEAAPRAVVTLGYIALAQPFSAKIEVCDGAAVTALNLDAIMPAHQHGMNYVPTITRLSEDSYQAKGLVFHMPGAWEIQVELTQENEVSRYTHTVTVR